MTNTGTGMRFLVYTNLNGVTECLLNKRAQSLSIRNCVFFNYHSELYKKSNCFVMLN